MTNQAPESADRDVQPSNIEHDGDVKNPHAPEWTFKLGAAFLILGLLFFMTLVLADLIWNKTVSPDSRFHVVTVLAITMSVGAAFIGGYATATGNWDMPFFKQPMQVGLAGGIAVFFLVMLGGHLIYSEPPESPSRVTTPNSFDELKTAYREKYEQLHTDLDTVIFATNVDAVRDLSYEQYATFLDEHISSNRDIQNSLKMVANFYDDVLKCEQSKPEDCRQSDVNEAFGEDIQHFWFSYGPYLSTLRDKGYPTIAQHLEQRAKSLRNS